MGRTQNILYVIPNLGIGGAEMHTINLINFLVEKGNVNVFLLVLCKGHLEALERLKLQPEKVRICKQESLNSLEKAAIGTYKEIINETVETIKEFKITDIIANLPLSHFICRMAKLKLALRFRHPKLYTYYHSVEFKNSIRLSAVYRAFLLFNRMLAIIFDNSSIFVSDASKQDTMKHFFARNPVTIHNCTPFNPISGSIADEYFKQKQVDLSGTVNIFFPGRFNYQKGHLFFLKAMREFIREKKLTPDHLKIIIAGDGSDIEKQLIVQEADEIKDFVIFTGRLQNEMVLSMMAYCDIVVVPSLGEAFGIVAIEALMQKAVVLTSDADGLRDIIEHGVSGYQFKTGDKADFLKKLEHIYCRPFKPTLSKKKIFQRYKENYDIDNYFQNFCTRFSLGLKI